MKFGQGISGKLGICKLSDHVQWCLAGILRTGSTSFVTNSEQVEGEQYIFLFSGISIRGHRILRDLAM